jgi:predicted phosphate transport protein (TIGR00153 family)
MLTKLMPRSDDFFTDFEKQAAATVEGARLLKDLLDNFVDVKRKCQAIRDIEHLADDITHRAYERLHKNFITPFDRGEIHRLLGRIDDVLDYANAAAERIGLYEIASVVPESRELATVLLAQTKKMEEAVRGLRNVKDPKRILEACKEMNLLENQADTALREGVARLFKSGVDPLTVMKWKEVLDLIESATDRCEDVANIIEGVVLEHA